MEVLVQITQMVVKTSGWCFRPEVRIIEISGHFLVGKSVSLIVRTYVTQLLGGCFKRFNSSHEKVGLYLCTLYNCAGYQFSKKTFQLWAGSPEKRSSLKAVKAFNWVHFTYLDIMNANILHSACRASEAPCIQWIILFHKSNISNFLKFSLTFFSRLFLKSISSSRITLSDTSVRFLESLKLAMHLGIWYTRFSWSFFSGTHRPRTLFFF